MALASSQLKVSVAVKDLNDCTDSVKQMFLAALPNLFGPDLHAYQKETAAMLRKSLEHARAAAGEVQVEATQRVMEARTVLETFQADVADTTACEDAARSVLHEKTTALESAQAVVEMEEKLCEEAKKAKDLIAEEREKLEAAKNEIESVQNGSLRMLLDGGWEDVEVRDACIEGVCSYLKNADTDVVLMASLPKALARRPADYGEFDKITIEETLRVFGDKIQSFTVQLSEGEERFEDATAEHMGAWAILDLARESVEAAREVRDKADQELQSAAGSKNLAVSKVSEQDTVLESLLKASAAADTKVQQFEEALRSFALLEAGEEPDAENKENAMPVDMEENAKGIQSMVVDQSHNPVTA